MRIVDLVVDIVEWEVTTIPVVDDRGHIGGRIHHGLVRVRTDAGIEAVGMLGPLDDEISPCLTQLTDVIKPRLLGLEITDPARLWARLDSWAGHGFPLQPAMSAVDIALWDALAKERSVPVYTLLGGRRRQIPVVATSPPIYQQPEMVASQVEQAAGSGFGAYKIHPGAASEPDAVRMIQLSRAVAGEAISLMFDPNNAYDLGKALAIGRALDEAGFEWYEDPVPFDDWESIQTLTEALDTPLAMSDALGFLANQARLAVRLGAPQVIRVSARKLGITGLKALCDELSDGGVAFEIGFGGNALANAANQHVASSVAGSSYYEHMLPADYHEVGTATSVTVENGAVCASEAPGLGVELDRDLIARHTVETLG